MHHIHLLHPVEALLTSHLFLLVQIVFALTVANHLWRSEDGGISWVDQTATNKVEALAWLFPCFDLQNVLVLKQLARH